MLDVSLGLEIVGGESQADVHEPGIHPSSPFYYLYNP